VVPGTVGQLGHELSSFRVRDADLFCGSPTRTGAYSAGSRARELLGFPKKEYQTPRHSYWTLAGCGCCGGAGTWLWDRDLRRQCASGREAAGSG